MPDATDQAVVTSRAGAVATVTVNRPRALNALDPDTLRALAAALDALADDRGVRALVVTGAGDRAFVAGADIAAMAAMTPAAGREYCRLGHEVFARLEMLPVPAVAAVNGAALGGGLELALACDLVLASERARLGLPEITLGLIPGFGGTQRLALRIGLARARELVYLGRVLNADEALAIGLVNRVVPADRLADEAATLAADLASRAPMALRHAKAVTGRAATAALADGLAREVDAFAATFATEDRVEGLTAFLEKRKPLWKGR